MLISAIVFIISCVIFIAMLEAINVLSTSLLFTKQCFNLAITNNDNDNIVDTLDMTLTLSV